MYSARASTLAVVVGRGEETLVLRRIVIVVVVGRCVQGEGLGVVAVTLWGCESRFSHDVYSKAISSRRYEMKGRSTEKNEETLNKIADGVWGLHD
jgi:hypothetical protein